MSSAAPINFINEEAFFLVLDGEIFMAFSRKARMREIWPLIPADQRGRRLTRDEEDDILGFGAGGALAER